MLGAVVRQEQAESAALAPAVEEARSAVEQAAVVNMDETGCREDKQRAWLWTVVTAELTVVRIDRRRGGAVVEALLGADFAGVDGSDRWSAYNRFPADRRAVCHAHLKHHFQALVHRGGEAEPIGCWGLAEIERLFAPWHRLRAGECDRRELQRRLIPLQARLRRLLRRGWENPDRKAAGLCRILRARGDERFVGLPVFASHKFRHDAVFVHVGAAIERPEDLRGRRVGIPDYLYTANFWVRAFLQHDYAVPPEAILWVHGRGEMSNLGLPQNVPITDAPDGRELSDLLEGGDIDAFERAEQRVRAAPDLCLPDHQPPVPSRPRGGGARCWAMTRSPMGSRAIGSLLARSRATSTSRG